MNLFKYSLRNRVIDPVKVHQVIILWFQVYRIFDISLLLREWKNVKCQDLIPRKTKKAREQINVLPKVEGFLDQLIIKAGTSMEVALHILFSLLLEHEERLPLQKLEYFILFYNY